MRNVFTTVVGTALLVTAASGGTQTAATGGTGCVTGMPMIRPSGNSARE